MPPLISDEEASEDEIPFQTPAEAAEAEEKAGEDEGSGSEDGDQEEFIVEKILNHAKGEDGEYIYEVKWQGYPKKGDHTWEPEVNLTTARETLEEYFRKIGGRPGATEEPVKKRKRKTDEIETSKSGNSKKPKSSTPEIASKNNKGKGPAKKSTVEWKPPNGSWETHIANIDTIEELRDDTTGQLERYCYVVWGNGHKTRHQLSTINKQAPQKMLRYYENHLVFRQPEEKNGQNESAEYS